MIYSHTAPFYEDIAEAVTVIWLMLLVADLIATVAELFGDNLITTFWLMLLPMI